MNTYFQGTAIRLSGNFTDTNNATIDPTSVTLRLRTPDRAVANYTPTKDATGQYHYDFTITQSGIHYYRFEGTGAAAAAAEQAFNVNKSNVI